jgi:hypothetical protein
MFSLLTGSLPKILLFVAVSYSRKPLLQIRRERIGGEECAYEAG